jgi:hypothetical protein
MKIREAQGIGMVAFIWTLKERPEFAKLITGCLLQ